MDQAIVPTTRRSDDVPSLTRNDNVAAAAPSQQPPSTAISALPPPNNGTAAAALVSPDSIIVDGNTNSSSSRLGSHNNHDSATTTTTTTSQSMMLCPACGVQTYVANRIVCNNCQSVSYCSVLCREWDFKTGGHDMVCSGAAASRTTTPASTNNNNTTTTTTTSAKPSSSNEQRSRLSQFFMRTTTTNNNNVDAAAEQDDEEDVQSMDEESMAFSQIHESTSNDINVQEQLNAISEESNVTDGPVSEASWRHKSSNVSNDNNNSTVSSLPALPNPQPSSALGDLIGEESDSNLLFQYEPTGGGGMTRKPTQPPAHLLGTTSLPNGTPRQIETAPPRVEHSSDASTATNITPEGGNASGTMMALISPTVTEDDRLPRSVRSQAGSFASPNTPSRSSLKFFRESYNNSSDSSGTSRQQRRKHRSASLDSTQSNISTHGNEPPELVRTSSLKNFRDIYNAEMDRSDDLTGNDSESQSTTELVAAATMMTPQQVATTSRQNNDDAEVSSVSLGSKNSDKQEANSILGELNITKNDSESLSGLTPSPYRVMEVKGGGGSMLNNTSASSARNTTEADGGTSPDQVSSLQMARLRNESMRNSLNSALRVYEQLYGEDAAKNAFQRLTNNLESPASSSKRSPEQQRQKHSRGGGGEQTFDWKRVKQSPDLDTRPSVVEMDTTTATVSSVSLATGTNHSSIAGGQSPKTTPQGKVPTMLPSVNQTSPKASRTVNQGEWVKKLEYESAIANSIPKSSAYMKYRASLSPPNQKSAPGDKSFTDNETKQTSEGAHSQPLHQQTARKLDNALSIPNDTTTDSRPRNAQVPLRTTNADEEKRIVLDPKVDKATPQRSNKTSDTEQPPSELSPAKQLYRQYRETLVKKSSVNERNKPNSNTESELAEIHMDYAPSHVAKNSGVSNEKENASSKLDHERSSAPRYMKYRESLAGSTKRIMAASTESHRVAQSVGVPSGKPKASEGKSIMSGFTDSFHARTNSAEFLDVWNRVESDRAEIEAEMAAAKKAAAAKPTEEKAVTTAQSIAASAEQQKPGSRLAQLFRSPSSKADDMDIECGYLSAKAESSENDGESMTTTTDRSRNWQYWLVALILIALPLSVGFGVAYSKPRRRDIPVSSSSSVKGNTTSSPQNAPSAAPEVTPFPTSAAPAVTSFPTSTDEVVFGPTLDPLTSQPRTFPTNSPIVTAMPTMPPTTMFPSDYPSQFPTNAPTLSPTTLSPTRTPSATRTVVAEQLFRLLVAESFDFGSSILSEGSPQNLAFEWLASNPDVFSTFSTTRIIQRYALATFYYSTDGNNWLRNLGWLSDADECTWVTSSMSTELPNCDADGVYVNLNVGENNLSGILPCELALLTGLESLMLKGGPQSRIGGILPKEIGLLSQLKVFDAQDNAMFGEIPTRIGSLRQLQTLNLGMNGFNGSLSTELATMTSLQVLNLTMNALTGGLPEEFDMLTNLEALVLSKNGLSGSVMIGSSLTRLRILHIEQNMFASIGPHIGSMTSLETLRAGNNSLSGRLTSAIGRLTLLQRISLNSNNLTGAIPSEIGELWNLTNLDLSDNSFSGPIPTEIGRLTMLRSLDLQSNNLVGPIPDELGNLELLSVAKIQDNDITGSVSDALCDDFSNIFPIFQLDCLPRTDGTIELMCPTGSCCTFCCNDEAGCQCVYENTDFDFLCSER